MNKGDAASNWVYAEGTLVSAVGAEGVQIQWTQMQDAKVAAGRFKCGNAIGMSVRRVDVVACANFRNRKVV